MGLWEDLGNTAMIPLGLNFGVVYGVAGACILDFLSITEKYGTYLA
jgi:hypothetical protein